MKAYFDDNGCLMIEAENNTEKVALSAWLKGYSPMSGEEGGSAIGFDPDAHLKTQPSKSDTNMRYPDRAR